MGYETYELRRVNMIIIHNIIKISFKVSYRHHSPLSVAAAPCAGLTKGSLSHSASEHSDAMLLCVVELESFRLAPLTSALPPPLETEWFRPLPFMPGRDGGGGGNWSYSGCWGRGPRGLGAIAGGPKEDGHMSTCHDNIYLQYFKLARGRTTFPTNLRVAR